MNEYIKKIIELYTRGHLGEEAKVKFQDWLADEKFAEEKEEALLEWWNQSGNVVTKDTFDSLASVKSKAQRQRKDRGSKRGVILWRYAAAIVLMICSTTIYLFTQREDKHAGMIEYFTQAGQMDTIYLPDGSVVQTNSRTIILYSESFGEDNRTVYLSGEANFKVQKNEELPFIVQAKDFSVTALGTELDVSSYFEDPYFRTFLVEGSIKVQKDGQENSYILKPNEQFLYDKQNEEYGITRIDLYEATAWQRGDLIFRSITIPEILHTMERKYAVSFQYKSSVFNDDKYTFKFKKESSLNDMLEVIKGVSANFDYKQRGDSYYITSSK